MGIWPVAVWWPEELELPPDIILNPAHQTHQARLPGLRVEIQLLLLCINKCFGNLAFINSDGGFGLDIYYQYLRSFSVLKESINLLLINP